MKYIKVFDILFIILVALAIFFAFWNVFSHRLENPVLVVNSPDGEYVYPLEKNMNFEVQGVLGITTIAIENRAAFVVDSPCRNKNCVSSAKMQSGGDWTACLPNKIFLHIEAEQTDLDALSK